MKSRLTRIHIYLLGYLMLLFASGVHAQTMNNNDRWNLETNFPGTNDNVSVVLASGENVFIGGQFTEAGGLNASSVARFNQNSRTWHTLGDGVSNPVENPTFVPSVSALAVSGDDIYVGGRFSAAGNQLANHIAHYDLSTNSWNAIGSGVEGEFAQVLDAKIVNDNLYISGSFTSVNGIPANGIARYNITDEEWHSVGEGVEGTFYSMAITDNEIYLGGFLDESGSWGLASYSFTDGSWQTVVTVSGQVNTLLHTGDALYIGGSFTEVDGVSANRVAKYDISSSTWTPLGSGVNNMVSTLELINDHLYVGGSFTSAGGSNAFKVTRYDLNTEEWAPFYNGFTASSSVRDMSFVGEILFVGGNIPRVSGFDASNIVSFNITNEIWQLPSNGLGGEVNSIVVENDEAFVGGTFTSANGFSAARVASYNVNTRTWSALGEGIQAYTIPSNSITVDVLLVHDGYLYVGGRFQIAGEANANHIARYNISEGTWSGLGSGLNDRVQAMAIVDEVLYAGGTFTNAGGNTANRIAKYDLTTETWSALGSGVDGTVRALEVIGSELYVGGHFTSAGSENANYIARYDTENETWHPLGNGTDDNVLTITANNGNLYAGGSFNQAGGNEVRKIARYNPADETWISIGGPQYGYVSAIVISENRLYIGGFFQSAADVNANRVALYDLSEDTWQSLGNGMNDAVLTLAIYGENLLAGGRFITAGSKPASHFARWDFSVNPVSISETVNGIPQGFLLEQNYPNPFNPTTQIRYTLPESGHVSLDVYSISGQHIANVVSRDQTAGEHTATFDASRLSSGIYLYRLQVGSMLQIRKMTLIK